MTWFFDDLCFYYEHFVVNYVLNFISYQMESSKMFFPLKKYLERKGYQLLIVHHQK
jgi:hypothetical protein